MNEEYLQEIYNIMGGKEAGINYDAFKTDVSSNKEYNKQVFDFVYSGAEGVDYNAFAFDTGLKKKEPTQSVESPLQEGEEVSVSVGEIGLPTVRGDITAEQGKIEIPKVLQPISDYKEADFGELNPMAMYGDFQRNESILADVNEKINKYEQAQSQTTTSSEMVGRGIGGADLSKDLAELKNQRQRLMSTQKGLSSKMLTPLIKESQQLYLNEDGTVKDGFYSSNVYGLKTPNIKAINELAKNMVRDESLRVKFAEELQQDIDFNINVNQEELNKVALEKIESQMPKIKEQRDQEFEKQYGDILAKDLSKATHQLDEVSTKLKGEYEQESATINQEISAITEQYKSIEQQINSAQYTSQEEVDIANQELKKAYSDYQKSYSEAIDKNSELLTQYNARINNEVAKLQEAYQGKVNQMASEFEEKNPISKEIIDKAYGEALAEQMAKAKKAKQFVVSQGGIPLRFGTSTLSSFGTFVEMVGATFGGDGETGKKMQQYFQPTIDPIKGFKDLTVNSLTESAGNLVGSMLPSITASMATAVATKNLSASARIMSTALAGFSTETADLMGRSYREALKRSGSVEEAQNAAKQTFDSQLLIAPTYVLDALPFVGGIKGISNPVLRFGANGALEYSSETFLQEYPQTLFETAIAETGDATRAGEFASLESLEETAANTLPVFLMGGGIAQTAPTAATPTPDQFLQKIEKVLRAKGETGVARLLSELHLSGSITKDEMESLSAVASAIDINNSEEYNAIKYRRDLTYLAKENESDAAKIKIMDKQIKAYDSMLEAMLEGKNVKTQKVKIGGDEFFKVTDNPIQKLEQDEKVQQEETLQEQENVNQEEINQEEQLRQEEQARVLEEYNALSPEDKLELKDIAIDQMQNEMAEKGIKEYELTSEMVDERASQILQQDIQNIEGILEGETRFSIAEEGESAFVADPADSEAITEEMNQMDEAEVNFTTPKGQTTSQVNPFEASNSTTNLNENEISDLGFESQDDMVGGIEEFNGIPMITGVSDIAAGGTIKDSKGNDMNAKGGIMFNALAKVKAAWAGVKKETSQGQYDNAVKLYKKNKDLFDRLWDEGRLPKGHIPMAIIRMGNDAINSNELVFRYLAPEIKEQSTENQTAALNELVSDLKRKKGKFGNNPRLLQFIADNNIKTLGGLMDAVVTDANSRAKGDVNNTLTLDERAELFYNITSPEGVSTPNKSFLKALYNGTTDNSSVFASDNIYAAVGEPSMMKANKGDVVSIVGVDVLNGGVIDIDHPNYGSGPKGRLIKLIKNPTSGMEVFPEWKAKSNRVFKKDKTGKRPSEKNVSSQTMGTVANDKAFQGASVQADGITDMQQLAAKFRFAFPDVTVVATQQEFDAMLKETGVRTKVSKGKTILGMTKDGKVFLNPEQASLGTPIHEFGHIWIDFLRSKASGRKGTGLLEKGLKLVEGTPALKAAIEKYGDNKLAREEALVELMATKGETIINAAKKSRFKEWMNATFKYIKEKFSTLAEVDEKKIEAMSLDDFINVGLADLFAGKPVDAKAKENNKFDAAKESQGMMPRFSLGDDVAAFIKDARGQGISEVAIKTVLNRRGVSMPDIKAAFEKEAEETTEGKKIDLDEASIEKVNEAMRISREKASADKTFKKRIKDATDRFVKRFIDSASPIKSLMDKSGLSRVTDRLVTTKGASARAKAKFKEIDDKIYSDLSKSKNEALDDIIQVRRIKAIEENRKKRGLKPIKHPNNITLENANAWLTERAKDSDFEALNERADMYFDKFRSMLREAKEDGLVSQETLDQLIEVDYQPRKFIQYLIQDDVVDPQKVQKIANEYGLSESMIKSLNEGSADGLVTDSRWLLASAMNSLSKRRAFNEVNKTIAKELPKVLSRYNELKKKPNKSKAEIKELKNLEEINKNFKEAKPIRLADGTIRKTKEGNIMYPKKPKGFSTLHYYEDGDQKRVYVSPEVYEQWYDTKQGIMSPKMRRFVATASGSRLLKAMATGINAFFAITNFPRDFGHIIMSTDIYQKNVGMMIPAIANLTADFIGATRKMSGGMNNKTFSDFVEYGGMLDFMYLEGSFKNKVSIKNFVSPKAKIGAKKFFDFLTAANRYSEIGFRLAVFDKVSKEGMKEIDAKGLTGKEREQAIKDLKHSAARQAREIIDFSQAGYITRDLESGLPYLKAATQGSRVAINYFIKNPVKAFGKTIEAMGILTGLTYISSLALISALRGDDDEDKKAGEIFLETMEGVSPYVKRAYFVIPTGTKDDKGEWQYIRVAKTPQFIPFASLAEGFMQRWLASEMGRKPQGVDVIMDEALEGFLNHTLPIDPRPSKSIKDALNRNPLAGGIIGYVTEYDLFRDRPLFYNRGKDIPEEKKGYYQKGMPEFYKAIADETGLSPAKMKFFVEKFITTPSTNPTVGMVYALANSTVSDESLSDNAKKSAEDLIKSASKKVIGSTSQFNRDLRTSENLEQELEKNRVGSIEQNQKIRDFAIEYGEQLFDTGDIPREVEEYIQSLPKEEQESAVNKFISYASYGDSAKKFFDIIHEPNEDNQAVLIKYKFGTSEREIEEGIVEIIRATKGKWKPSKKLQAKLFK